MRKILLALCLMVGTATSAIAAVSINIGINLGSYPDFVAIPGYPVYYAPRLDANVFFYDGFYWVYSDDRWYSSSWYDGPWDDVDAYFVPLFLLRVPVRYYRRPPSYFRGWLSDAPPRWGEHWGRGWEQRRRGWDQWNRASAPRPAPLPAYQRNYSGDRYPRAEQQRALREQNYRYQPRDAINRDRERQQQAPRSPQQSPRQIETPRQAMPQRDRNQEQQRDRAQQPQQAPRAQPQAPRAEQPAQQPSSQQRDRGATTRQPERSHDTQQQQQQQQRQQPQQTQQRGNDRGNGGGKDERKQDKPKEDKRDR